MDANERFSAQMTALCLACARCADPEALHRLCREEVRQLLRHESLLIVVAKIDVDRVTILRLMPVDHPINDVAMIAAGLTLANRKILHLWLAQQAPLVIDAADSRASDFERAEIDRLGLGTLGIHGVVDPEVKSGVYLSFAGLKGSAEDGERLLRLIAPPLCQAVLATMRSEQSTHPLRVLSKSERETLLWAARGKTNAEIARLRSRSVATVRNQLHAAFEKLGVSNRSEAVKVVLSAPTWLE